MSWSQMALAGLCALLAVGAGCTDSSSGATPEAAPRQARQHLGTLEPRQVRDINHVRFTASGSSPDVLTVLGETLFFSADEGTAGHELWVSDGTEAGTRRVKDIYAGHFSSSPSALTGMNGILYFIAEDATAGHELWRSDGTEAGTRRVKDIAPGTPSGLARFQQLVAFQDHLYFVADDGSGTGAELWRSDGTEAGTTLVKDISPGSTSSTARSFAVMGGFLYFVASDGVSGQELWRTDGTPEGTVLFQDLSPGRGDTTFNVLVPVGGLLYISADSDDWALWRSDGTAAGTFPLRRALPVSLAAMGGVLYFSDLFDDELWRTDGTLQGTFRVKDIHPRVGSGPGSLRAVGSTLYFFADDGVHGQELWKSDGTDQGTVLVKDIIPGASLLQPFPACGVGGVLFFTASDSGPEHHGYELWRSDGTEAGTYLVKDLLPGAESGRPNLLRCTQRTLFLTADDGVHGNEVWRSDGTEAGTFLVKDVWNMAGSSHPKHFADVGGTVFFQATDGLHGPELWKTDGTHGGTVRVRDLRAGPTGSEPGLLTPVGSKLAFVANDGVSGAELWWSDGTEAGTLQPRDILPGSRGAAPGTLTAVGGVLYFSAEDGVNGPELWRSDGTPGGTALVKDLRPGSLGSYPLMAVAWGGTLFFFANDGVRGVELWKSDGTPEGTVLVKDIQPGPVASVLPEEGVALRPVVFNGLLYFAASDGVHGEELWRSDGTPEGTSMLKELNPGQYGSGPRSLTVVGDVLYFSAGDVDTNVELWRSDGTPEGTFLVKDIHPTYLSGPASFTAAGGRVFFVANDGKHGVELWKTDGTAEGTALVKDISPGFTGSKPTDLVALEGEVYFRADDGVNGTRLWKSDGTEAGTVIAWELAAGDLSASPEGMLRVGSSLYFSGWDGVSGVEPWRLAPAADPQDPPDTEAPTLTCPAPVTVEASGPSGAALRYPAATVSDAGSAPSLTYQPSHGSTLPVGTTQVRVTATDRAGNSATCTFSVTVRDTVAPRVECPAPLTAEATSEAGAPVSYPVATASDAISEVSLAYSLASGSTFPLGTTDVRVTATDTSNNSATCTFPVTVRDTTPPRVGCPGPLTAEAQDSTGASVAYSVAAPTDEVTRSPSLASSHAPGSRFPLGTTTVTLTATDAAKNAASCSFTVTVRDSTSPTLACPAPLTAEATGEAGAPVQYPEATASDTVSAVSLAYSPASGSTLPLGTTDVQVTATDGAGNASSCTLAVTVRDTTPPRVGCPGPLTAEAQDATGASVAYSTPAPFDEVTRAPTISASHAPGSRFPLGTTEVTLTATDAANNAASCSFSVTVRDTTAPALACPASVTVASTLEEEVVDYPAATASDAVTAPLVVSYSHPSGGRFPKGTTRVTASTVDGAGLRSDCSFDVTVREPPPSSTHVNAVATLGCAASGAGGNSGLALWLLLGAGTLWSRRRRTPAAPAR